MTDKTTDLEAQAIDKGWRPKEEWEGEPELWVDAGEFIRRGELMDRISDQTKALKTAQQQIDLLKTNFQQMTDHNKKMAKKEFDDVLKTLKAQKVEALDSGESEKVVELDEKIDELKQAGKELDSDTESEPNPNGPNSQQVPQEVLDWEKSNSWYFTDPVMQGTANGLISDYVQKNPQDQGNFQKILAHVDENIGKYFDTTQGRTRPGATVDPNSTGRSSGKGKDKVKYSINDLTPEQRKVAKAFSASGIMSTEDYIKDLAELNELDTPKLVIDELAEIKKLKNRGKK